MIHVDYIVNHFFSSRTYIITDNKDDNVWLVDCGDVDGLNDLVSDKSVVGVLLTHTHSDHIYGLSQLLEKYPRVKIITNSYGYDSLIAPKRNLSRYHRDFGDIILSDRSNVIVVVDGEVIDVLGERCEVFETPGHDPSCLCFRIGNKIFTGDAYIPGVKVFTGFPFSDKKKASDSVERIISLSSGLEVYSGHEIKAKNEK